MKNVWKSISELLLQTNTPLWVSLLGFIFASFGVYYLTPLINQKLETQKIKSDYVMKSLDNLNSKTQEMFAEISIVNRKISLGQNGYSDNLDKAIRLSTELQWKALEISAVLKDNESTEIIQEFQESLQQARSKIVDVKSAPSSLTALEAMKKFVPASLKLTNRIASLSGIKFE